MALPVDFGVEDLCNFVLRFAINFYGRRRRLDTVQDGVKDSRLKLGDMEDWVNGSHGVREAEGA
jgi:hypothetical protein